MSRCIALSFVALFAAAMASQGADIVWSITSPLSSASDVSTNGQLLEALNFHGGANALDRAVTINGVAFEGFVSGQNGSTDFRLPKATYFSSDTTRVTASDDDDYLAPPGVSIFDPLLSGRLFGPDGNTATLSNLQVGRSYEVQLFFGGTEISNNRHIVIDDGAPGAFGSQQTTNFGDDTGSAVGPFEAPPNPAGFALTGQFTADQDTQSFTITNYIDLTPPNSRFYLPAYQLRLLPTIQSATLNLEVNTTTGAVTLVNDTSSPVEFSAYEITSPSGSLQVGAWNSLQQQNRSGFAAGSGNGDGWEEADNSNDSQLGEGFVFGSSTLPVGESVHLGSLFDSSGGDDDLQFSYVQAGALAVRQGGVTYIDGGLPGDYNGDGSTDAADYTAWRDALGSTTALRADGNGNGRVDAEDYLVWRDNYGRTAAPAHAAGESIPEPAAWCLLAIVAACGVCWTRCAGRSALAAVWIAAGWLGVTSPVGAAQPNIVFVMADDMSWVDSSVASTTRGYQSDFYETPALEAMAAQGMSFTSAYSAGPNCTPTRAALLSGQYATRPTNNIYAVGGLNKVEGASVPLRGISDGEHLSSGALTIADVMRSAGYTTAHFGKYHVGDPDRGNGPLSHGFDFNYGGTDRGAGAGGGYHSSFINGAWQFPQSYIGPELDSYAAAYTQDYINSNINPYSTPGVDTSVLLGRPKHVSDALADAALDFMGSNASAPFFMHFAHHAPHNPTDDLQGRDDLINKYQAKRQTNPSQMGHDSLGYAALVEGADQTVARLINYLDSTPDPRNPGSTLSANTLLIFYSDNGGIEAPEGRGDNGVLAGQKGEIKEGGVRVPMIVRMPGTVPAATVNDTPVTSVDFFTTWASMAGATLPSQQVNPLDGADLTPVFADPSAVLGRDAIFWHFPGYLLRDTRDQHPQTALRSDADGHEWKLYYNYENQDWDLYDLAVDIGETTDLSGSRPDVVQSLGATMLEWLDDTDAPLATVRSGTPGAVLSVSGLAYSNRSVTSYNGSLVTIEPGEEMPLFLGRAVPWVQGDFNQDSVVDAADWVKLRQNLYTDLTGVALNETILRGDLNQDAVIDINDFLLFQIAYDASNGAGSFRSLLEVPEPGCFTMALAGLVVCGGSRASRRGCAGRR